MISALLVITAATVITTVAADPAAKPPLTATANRNDTQIRVLTDEKQTVLDIVCPKGIDRATIKRTGDKWPEPLLVRLHLKGLESFRASAGKEKINWAFSSSDATRRSTPINVADGGTVDLPLFDLAEGPHNKGKLLIVDSPYKIPLAEGGYFEVWLPVKLLKDNPAELKLSWVDFYR
ncbi:hypothetical protein [Blastopirellula retiformator]|uniref:Uncharacterized protein n=1 Tax=Blastopirellula retiformator TaxID=2527970 RepID=A0A5C5V1Y1_9BACT|nr:hypothetical protein [Blastopirellula retiformator]TWT32586.1 hypothetical protein Enr8_23900 [Blastopirellula retiformator]